jgi:hypothetical protein
VSRNVSSELKRRFRKIKETGAMNLNLRRFSVFILLFCMVASAVFAAFNFFPVCDNTEPETQGEIALSEMKTTYFYSIVDTAEWYAVRIAQSGEVFNRTEYVGFSKNSRGDIGFTSDGNYVGRLVPVVVGKLNGVWWLVPLRDVDNVNIGYVDDPAFFEVHYNGSGAFEAYEYDNYGHTANVDLIIHSVALKVLKATGEVKVSVDVSREDGALEDTGFGFCFVPIDTSKFRYAVFDSDNGQVKVDLTQVGKIVSTELIVDFWSQANERSGVKWNWRDLYELGANSHFEVVSVAGFTGLLTGSYGYGESQRITVDPSLTVNEDGSRLIVANTWTESGSTAGYNMTFLSSRLNIESLYDVGLNSLLSDYPFGGDTNSRGIMEYIKVGSTYSYSIETAVTWTIKEQSDTRAIVYLNGTESVDGDWDFDWQFTFYAGQRLFFFNETITNVDAGTLTVDIFEISIADDLDDDSLDYMTNLDSSDDVYTLYDSDRGGLSVFYVSGVYSPDGTYTYQDNVELMRNFDRNVGSGKTYERTFAFYVHGDTTAGAVASADELDDEIADTFPAITSVSGLSYDGRNNQTGAFDFTHSSGNDGSFAFAAVDTEQNMTAFHIANWSISDYAVYYNGTLKSEDTDYYAYYNSSSLALDIVYPVLASGTVEIRAGVSYTVTLSGPSSASLGETVTVSITVSRAKSTVSDWAINVTNDGGAFLTNYGESTFAFYEEAAVTHTFNVTGLYDADCGVSATPTCEGLSVVWQSGGSSSGPGSSDNNDDGVSPSPSTEPFEFPDFTPEDTSNLLIAVIIVCAAFVLALLFLSRNETLESRRKKFLSRKREKSQLGRKKLGN